MSEEESEDDGGDLGFSPAYSYPSNYLYLIIDAVIHSTAYVRASGRSLTRFMTPVARKLNHHQ